MGILRKIVLTLYLLLAGLSAMDLVVGQATSLNFNYYAFRLNQSLSFVVSITTQDDLVTMEDAADVDQSQVNCVTNATSTFNVTHTTTFALLPQGMNCDSKYFARNSTWLRISWKFPFDAHLFENITGLNPVCNNSQLLPWDGCFREVFPEKAELLPWHWSNTTTTTAPLTTVPWWMQLTTIPVSTTTQPNVTVPWWMQSTTIPVSTTTQPNVTSRACERFENLQIGNPSTYYVKYFKNSCYLFSLKIINWPYARTFCLEQGADLVAIETPSENQMIHQWAHYYRNDHLIIGGQWVFNSSSNIYLPTWVATNQTMVYTNFTQGHGDNGVAGGQYFYMMPASYAGGWGDYSGGTEAFVCEAAAAAMPTPVTPSFNNSHCGSRGNNVDAIFVVDGSGSIGSTSFREALDFVVTIVDSFDIDSGRSRVSVIIFDDTSSVALTLTYSASLGKEKTKNLIRGIRYPSGGTKTGTAINAAITEFKNKGRLKDDSVSSIAFVLTDGKSGDDVKLPADNAKDMGITIYAIGIGNGIDFNELNDISNDQTRVFRVSDTSMLKLILNEVEEKICEDLVGIQINCSWADEPIMTVLIPKKLQISRYVTIGSCNNRLYEAGYLRDISISNASEYWYTSISLSKCDSNMSLTYDYVSYYNVLWLGEEGVYNPDSSLIVRGNEKGNVWGLRCNYDRRAILTVGKDVGSWQPPDIDGEGTLPMSMEFYETSLFRTRKGVPVSVQLNERVFIQVGANLFEDLRLFLKTCWATPSVNHTDPIRYPILEEGCPVDDTLNRHDDGLLNQQRFSYQAFKFRGDYKRVHIHCEVLVCRSKDVNSRCHRGCQRLFQRRRRVTQDFIESSEVSLGPVDLLPEDKLECPQIRNFTDGVHDCTGLAPGSFCSFKCDEGFYLVGLPPSVKSVECQAQQNGSGPEWSRDPPTCNDIDECTVGGVDPCLSGASFAYKRCRNTPGSYVCECRQGFQPLPSDPDKCSAGSTLEGSIKFNEVFPSGLGDPTTDITAQITSALTSSMNDLFASIVGSGGRQFQIRITGFSPGSIVVHYEVFFYKDTFVDDVIHDPIDVAAVDEKIRRDWKPANVSGLRLVPMKEAFTFGDKDECRKPEDNDCSEKAICANTLGSYTCECDEGFFDVDGDSAEFPGRKCSPLWDGDGEVGKTPEGKTWEILAYVLAGFLIFVLPIACVIVKKTNPQSVGKVMPEQTEGGVPNPAYVEFPEAMKDGKEEEEEEDETGNENGKRSGGSAKKYSV